MSGERLSGEECIAWANRYVGVPWNMLALSTAANKDHSPVLVLQSLLAIVAALAGRGEPGADGEPGCGGEPL